MLFYIGPVSQSASHDESSHKIRKIVFNLMWNVPSGASVSTTGASVTAVHSAGSEQSEVQSSWGGVPSLQSEPPDTSTQPRFNCIATKVLRITSPEQRPSMWVKHFIRIPHNIHHLYTSATISCYYIKKHRLFYIGPVSQFASHDESSHKIAGKMVFNLIWIEHLELR